MYSSVQSYEGEQRVGSVRKVFLSVLSVMKLSVKRRHVSLRLVLFAKVAINNEL